MTKQRYFQFTLFTLYMLGMTGLMIWQGVGITPDRYALVLLLGSLLIKKTRQFLLDWVPFLFILISYDFLRSLSDKLNPRVHFVEGIFADKSFFGEVPTLTLQRMFYHAGTLHWYDWVATVFYLLHFALPLGFGFLLWFNNRRRFHEFTLSLVLLSYAGWITYLIFPEAPPWLAAKEGYLPHVTQITLDTLSHLPSKVSIPTIYQSFDPNPVASIPSIHAAYPMLILLLSLSFFGWKALIFVPYVVGICLSIVYLGEHYVIDIIIGFIYALATFGASKFIMNHTAIFAPIKKAFKKAFHYDVEM